MSVKRHHPFSMKSVFCLFHNPTFRTFYEIHDILDFFTHRNLIDNLLDSILNTEITLVNQSVCIGDVTEDRLGCFVMFLKNHRFNSMLC